MSWRTEARERLVKVVQLLTAANVTLCSLEIDVYGLTESERTKAHDLQIMVEFWGELADKFRREFEGEFLQGTSGDGI